MAVTPFGTGIAALTSRPVGSGPGGHFAAMEPPDLLVRDMRAFFRRLREKGWVSGLCR
ncbi:hypothetical protein [Streptomyces sp. NPDC013187]|uniref:hypothetical protein n=1 Tax=Streptomyces sp. NPDC013187 TaxID=3364865 RepID=UPI003676E1A0